MHCMIDCETLSTRKNAALVSIGALKFDPLGDDRDPVSSVDTIDQLVQIMHGGFYVRVDYKNCAECGLHVDPNTVKWWMSQDGGLIAEAFNSPDRKTLIAALDELQLWLGNVECVWSKGANFDLAILEELYTQVGRRTPWKYTNTRCVRTAYGMAQIDDKAFTKPNAHHPLWDCYYQILGVQESYRKLGLTPAPETGAIAA